MSLTTQSSITVNESNYSLKLAWDETTDQISEISYSPNFDSEFSLGPPSEVREQIQNGSLGLKEKYLALKLLELSINDLKETPQINISEQVCPCFKISKNDVHSKAHEFYKDQTDKDLRSFLLKSFPMGSACTSCLPVLDKVIQEFKSNDFRETEWNGKSNVQWVKDIFLQLPEEIEILDFYNGKLYLKTDVSPADLEEILQNYFNLKIQVFLVASDR